MNLEAYFNLNLFAMPTRKRRKSLLSSMKRGKRSFAVQKPSEWTGLLFEALCDDKQFYVSVSYAIVINLNNKF